MRICYLVALACTPLAAQIGGNGSGGTFAPTSNVTLDTTADHGVFQFTRVAIPAGVTVTIIGPNPATILAQQGVDIAGTLSADGASLGFNTNLSPGAGGPGGYAGGQGGLSFGSSWYANDGQGPGGGRGSFPSTQPTKGGGGGGHATEGQPGSSPWGGGAGGSAYGSIFPFELEGGSGGGGGYEIGRATQYCGAGGGGALAILSDGPIRISGTVSANGGDSEFLVSGFATTGPFGGGGSGGAILIRSMTGVDVLSSGSAAARGGVGIHLLFGGQRIPSGGAGFIRIDSYGVPPTIQGTTSPVPLVLTLPALQVLEQPTLGGSFRMGAAAVPGDIVLFFLAFQTGNLALPPFGTVLIDPSAALLGWGMASPGIDPISHQGVAVPNDPRFLGWQLHCQALNLFSVAQARLTNAVVATVQ